MAAYDDSTSLLLDRVLPSPGILKLKKIRLWIAVIIAITVLGAIFLLKSTHMHELSSAYMAGASQYQIKDTKVSTQVFLEANLNCPKRQILEINYF